MNNRLLLVLSALLAFVTAISIWLYVKAPLATSGQIMQEHSSESAVQSARAQLPAGGAGGAEAQPQVVDSIAREDEAIVIASPIQAVQAPVQVNGPSADERLENAHSPQEGVALVLSDAMFAAIENVQQLQLDGQWEESLDVLNALYEDFDALNSFEQTTLLNFYTNTLLRFEMWPEAIGAFSRMLTMPDLRPDIGARALMALGQLHARVGEYAASISYLRSWQDLTVGMENMERSNERVSELIEQSRLGLYKANNEVR